MSATTIEKDAATLRAQLVKAQRKLADADTAYAASYFNDKPDAGQVARLATVASAAASEAAALERLLAGLDGQRARAAEAGAILSFDRSAARRAEIAKEMLATLGTERDLLSKLRAAQLHLAGLIDEDWAEAGVQSAAVATAKLGRDVATRHAGLGLPLLDFDHLAAGLAADEATVKGGKP